MSFVLELIQGGWDTLLEYLSFHVLTCLIPAFFIAGAIAVFISQAAILKYFGPKANKFLSYGVASVSGTVLAVCSCTILPLFGGIFKRGAGLGPAITFLYAGPAINVLAIIYSARLLGYDIGLARALGAIVFSIVIGIIMAWIYRKEKTNGDERAFANIYDDPSAKKLWQILLFFGSLVGILVFAASKNWIMTGIMFTLLFFALWRWFSRQDIAHWMKETWRFFKMILPWLLGGVFVAGMLAVLIPEDVVAKWVGGNSIQANALASVSGMLMYFATLTEVPIVRTFIDLGMGKGPALALLLAGPAVSLPSILVLRTIMGWRKTITYIVLVVIMATLTGFIFGHIV
ncbi:permease [Chloroflexota bacterium]